MEVNQFTCQLQKETSKPFFVLEIDLAYLPAFFINIFWWSLSTWIQFSSIHWLDGFDFCLPSDTGVHNIFPIPKLTSAGIATADSWKGLNSMLPIDHWVNLNWYLLNQFKIDPCCFFFLERPYQLPLLIWFWKIA